MTKFKTPKQPTNARERSLRQLRRTRQSKQDNKFSALVRRNQALGNRLRLSQLQNQTSKQNFGSLQQMLVEQQQSNREMRVQLAHLHRLQHDIDNAASEAVRATTGVAIAMIAMSEQVCRTCLGSRTIMKTKKKQRYSVECKACKIGA